MTYNTLFMHSYVVCTARTRTSVLNRLRFGALFSLLPRRPYGLRRARENPKPPVRLARVARVCSRSAFAPRNICTRAVLNNIIFILFFTTTHSAGRLIGFYWTTISVMNIICSRIRDGRRSPTSPSVGRRAVYKLHDLSSATSVTSACVRATASTGIPSP